MRYLLLVTVLIAAPASAQELKLPTGIFIASASADLTTTYVALDRGTAREANPLLGPFHSQPMPTVIAGAAYDAVAVYAISRFLGRKHPRIAATFFYVSAAYRSFLTYRTLHLLSSHEAACAGMNCQF